MGENMGRYRGKREDGQGWTSGYLIGPTRKKHASSTVIIDFETDTMHIVKTDTIGLCTGRYAFIEENQVGLIYQGDILYWRGIKNKINKGVVKWHEEGLWWVLEDMYVRRSLADVLAFCEHPLILGNVLDNPELIQVVKQ